VAIRRERGARAGGRGRRAGRCRPGRVRPVVRDVPRDLLPGRVVPVRSTDGQARTALPVRLLAGDRAGRRRCEHRHRRRGRARRRSASSSDDACCVRGGSCADRGLGVGIVTVAPAGLLSLEAARDAVLALAEPVEAETIAPADALGRVTAETVIARVSLPPWPNSAMDGYAILAADTATAGETTAVILRVIGDVAAGAAPMITVRPGTAVRIATGARLAEGADAVVPVEATTPLDAAGAAGARGPDTSGPLPAACQLHEIVAVGGSV